MSTACERRPRVVPAPLAPVALAVIVGIVADRYADPWGTRAWACITLAAVAVAVASRLRGVAAYAGLFLAMSALGGAWNHHCWSDLAPNDLALRVSETAQPAWVRGVIRDVMGVRPGDGPIGSTTRAVLDVTAICDGRAWLPARGAAQLVIAGDRPDLEAGQGVEAAGGLSAIAGPMNPGEFDYRAHLRAQGVRIRLAIDDPEGIWPHPSSRWTFRRMLGRVRAWSHARLVAGLDPEVAPLASALVLGRREAVDPDVNDAFARTGTTHLLAISGLHLQVLAGALLVGFRVLGLGRRGAYSAVALATVAYALLVGLMPSVVRSAAMTCIVCTADFFDRQSRHANALALAALVTVGLNPADLFDVGCQLSFLAIAAIAWGVGPASDLLRFAYVSATFRLQGPRSPLDALERSLEPWWLVRMRRWPLVITAGVVLSAVVWLAALPLVALRFHVVSPIGILLNIPLIPLTSIALMAAGLSLGLSTLWVPLGAPAAWVSAITLKWTESLVRWGASQSWGHTFVAGPSWVWVAGLYALLAIAMLGSIPRRPFGRVAWAALGAWILGGALLAVVPRPPARLEAEVLAVGHGLSVVIRTPDGRALLYDCGRMRDPSVGRRIIAQALWARGIRRLDAVVLSHADADHYNGLPDLLDRLPIAVVYVARSFAGPANPGAVRLLRDVRARGIPVRLLAEGDQWEWAGARFSVWHPPADVSPAESDNARSIVLDIESGGRRFLLTGDLEAEGLSRLVARPPVPLDAILSPHHGGRSANPEWLYAWASSGMVIVSQRPGVPGSRDALAPLELRGVPVLRTWRRGAIRLRFTPAGLTAQGFLD